MKPIVVKKNSVFEVYTLQQLRRMVSDYKTKHDVVNYSKLSKPKLIDLLEQKFTIHNDSLYYKLGDLRPQQAPQEDITPNFWEENTDDDDGGQFDEPLFDDNADLPPLPDDFVYVPVKVAGSRKGGNRSGKQAISANINSTDYFDDDPPAPRPTPASKTLIEIENK